MSDLTTRLKAHVSNAARLGNMTTIVEAKDLDTLLNQLAEAQAACAVKDEALNTVLGDFKKWGECCPNFSDGEYTQDYTTRRELINKALSPK